jgi:uncharacterized protein (TIGR02246 family)
MRPTLLLSLPLLALAACQCPPPAEPTAPVTAAVPDTVIEARMQAYVQALRVMDVERMASFFSATGELFEPGIAPIHGRGSILSFLKAFPGVVVDSASVQTRAVEVFGNTALLWGSFHEKLSFPGQPTSEQDGRFVAEWEQQADSTWLIERLYRIPLPPPMPVQ